MSHSPDGRRSSPARSPEAVVAAARRLADEVLFPASLAVDNGERPASELLDVLAAEGLYGLHVPADLGGLGLGREAVQLVMEQLASGCLTTTFVWVQHLSTAAVVADADGPVREEWARRLAEGSRRAGIAFSHLRHPDPPALTVTPVKGGYRVDGRAPLVTGWGMVDAVHVATRLGPDVVWLLVDAVEGPTLTATRLELAAVNASATVALSFAGHLVPEGRLTRVEPLSEWRERDAAGLRTNGFLGLGVARRCAALLGSEEIGRELDDLRSALLGASEREVAAVRARVTRFTLEAAAALVASLGGRSMVRDSHAQRLGREAMFLLVQGQTAAIRAAQMEELAEGLRERPS
ncbi:MAG TPA: acyl-CoA dehydrogenase family protein [Acidimicrobiales bacterium]|nr:acyl-CoA dehydrogenase family protein [Acidimicrobiales bacterium]